MQMKVGDPCPCCGQIIAPPMPDNPTVGDKAALFSWLMQYLERHKFVKFRLVSESGAALHWIPPAASSGSTASGRSGRRCRDHERALGETEMAVIFRIRFRDYILRFRRGNYSSRRILPFMERGPFGCWLASWKWGQVGWELRRWTE